MPALESVHEFNQHKHTGGDDEEINDGVDELSVGNNRDAGFTGLGEGVELALGVVEEEKEVGEIDAAHEFADGGHEDVGDEGADDLAERAADDEANREIDDAPTQGKLFKLFD